MNSYELVEAVRYLLEQRQSELMEETRKLRTGATRRAEIQEEIEELEDYVEKAREGYRE